MYAFERNQCRRFDRVLAVSPEDQAWFTVEYGAPQTSRIQTGVDTAFFRPSFAPCTEATHLVLRGAMDFAPNEDAASYMAMEVLPRLADQPGGLTLDIVGQNPSTSLQALARRDPRIQIIGDAADVRPYLERAAVVGICWANSFVCLRSFSRRTELR